MTKLMFAMCAILLMFFAAGATAASYTINGDSCTTQYIEPLYDLPPTTPIEPGVDS